MKALIFKGIKEDLEYKEVKMPEAGDGEVLVKMIAAGLNRRDYYITQGLYPDIISPTILGSDGCGEYQGQKYIINPNVGWGSNPKVQQSTYTILGLQKKGTLAEYVSVGQDRLHPKPQHLSDEEAAILPLGGLTAYRALISNCGVLPGDKVLIPGIGGGVALIGLQIALAIGAEVYVTSSSQSKIDSAIALGAKGGVNYRDDDWVKQLKSLAVGFDVVMDSVGGSGFSSILKLCNPGARIGFFGGTAGSWPQLNPGHLFFKQLTIHASTMGNDAEFRAMLSLVEQYKIKPIIGATYNLDQGGAALEALRDKSIFGKVCVRIST